MKHRQSFFGRHKNLLRWIIIMLLAGIVLYLVIGFFTARPLKNYSVDDKCGRFMNLMSHTIDDQNVCTAQCRNLCSAKESSYIKSQFLKSERGCNNCTCTCR